MVESLFIDQKFRYPDQFVVYFREFRLQGDQGLPFLRYSLFFRNGIGLHEAGDDILPLNAEDEISVDGDILRRTLGVPGQDHPGTRVFIQVAEHHRLDDHGRAPFVGKMHLMAVDPRLFGMPGGENLQDGMLELLVGIVRNLDAPAFHGLFIGKGELFHLFRIELDTSSSPS